MLVKDFHFLVLTGFTGKVDQPGIHEMGGCRDAGPKFRKGEIGFNPEACIRKDTLSPSDPFQAIANLLFKIRFLKSVNGS